MKTKKNPKETVNLASAGTYDSVKTASLSCTRTTQPPRSDNRTVVRADDRTTARRDDGTIGCMDDGKTVLVDG